MPESRISVSHRCRGLCAIERTRRAGSTSLVVMAHGGPGGDKRGPLGLFDALAEEVDRQLGLASLRFDFLGYGESDGTPLDMTVRSRAEELGSVVAWTRDRGYRKLALIAESLGGSVALRAVGLEFDVLVLLWPAVKLAETDLRAYFAPEKERELAENGFILDGKIPVSAEFVRECRELDLAPSLDRIVAPTLIVHGDADSCVPVAQAVLAHERLRGPKRLVVVPGGGHSLGRPYERAVVLAETIGWLREWLPH